MLLGDDDVDGDHHHKIKVVVVMAVAYTEWRKSTGSVYKVDIQYENVYWKTTICESARDIQSKCFIASGPGHSCVSAHHWMMVALVWF